MCYAFFPSPNPQHGFDSSRRRDPGFESCLSNPCSASSVPLLQLAPYSYPTHPFPSPTPFPLGSISADAETRFKPFMSKICRRLISYPSPMTSYSFQHLFHSYGFDTRTISPCYPPNSSFSNILLYRKGLS